MAKGSRAVHTRLALTVNARYYPAEGLSDGFYIDGRIPGKREVRGADLTIDREDRSFLMSIFGRPATDLADDSWTKPLHSVGKQVKSGTTDIDTEINNLAELAVEVTGRSTLKERDNRQPFFSGLVVMDGEVAAVTIGEGCAYLYRNDIIYPMTRDDFALEAIDYNGNAIESLDDYIAGSAGTIRYSNIAQLEVNDCIILCNLPVMEAIGQREMLRLMYEAEDQSDAAGMIMTQASAKRPGESLQVAIGFVESVVAEERTGKLNLGRFATGSVPAQKPIQEQKDPDLARTQRYHSSSMANILDEQERIYKAGQDAKNEPAASAAYQRDDFDRAADAGGSSGSGGYQRPQGLDERHAGKLDSADEYIPAPLDRATSDIPAEDFDRVPDKHYPTSVDDLYGESRDDYDDYDDYEDYSDGDQIQYQRAPDDRYRKDAGAGGGRHASGGSSRKEPEYSKFAVDRRRDDYDIEREEPAKASGLFGRRDKASADPFQSYNDYEDYDDPYGDNNADYIKRERTKRIIFYVVFGILILVSIYALIRLLNRGGDDPGQTTDPAIVSPEPDPTDPDSPITLPDETGTDDPADPGEATPTPDAEITPEPTPVEPAVEYVDHLVVRGDTLWGLAKTYFPNANRTTAINAIMDVNGWVDMEDTSNLIVGDTIQIPTRLD